MQTITSEEFARHASDVQKMAEREPVLITRHGKPAFVLQTYTSYQQNQETGKSFLDAILEADLPAELADIEFELPPRSTAQRPAIDWEND